MNNPKPFLSIKDTATETGLSQFYLRNGCKAGTIPHIRSGSTYLINLPLVMEKLNEESRMTDGERRIS